MAPQTYQLLWRPQRDDLNVAIIIVHGVAHAQPVVVLHSAVVPVWGGGSVADVTCGRCMRCGRELQRPWPAWMQLRLGTPEHADGVGCGVWNKWMDKTQAQAGAASVTAAAANQLRQARGVASNGTRQPMALHVHNCILPCLHASTSPSTPSTPSKRPSFQLYRNFPWSHN
eukprot:152337-Chlamydomonas_euryale.AAC.3